MAETTTARFGLLNWGASTDGPSRNEFNGNFNQIETLGALDVQDTLANRPAAGKRGTYFYATDNGILYRDTGSAWSVIGSRSVDDIITSSGTGAVPLTVSTATGQTADVFKAQVNSVDVARIDKDGDVFGNSFTGKYAALTGTDTAQVVAAVKGASGQTADLLQVRNNANADMLRVSAAGLLTSPYFATNANSSVVGAAVPTTPAGMSMYSANPILEVYSNRQGAGAYNDYVYVHHQAADATAVTRRLGLLFQIGEASGDATKSGGIGIESSAANAANPDLILYRGDSIFARFKSDGTSTLTTAPTISGGVLVQTTSTPSLTFNTSGSNQQIGIQNGINDVYVRTSPTGSLYFYAGGTHSSTGGDAGAGARVGQLLKVGSTGKFITGALRSTNVGEVNTSGKDLSIAVGDESGNHVGFSSVAVQSYSGAAATGPFGINPYGGTVTIGNGTSVVNANGQFQIAGKRVTVASSAPSSPAVGDVWIQIP